MHVRVRAALVAVELPVHLGQRGEVQNTATQLAEVAERASRGVRVEVLQNVVTDDNVKWRSRLVRLDLRVLPTKALTKIFTGLDAGVRRPRQVAFEPGLQQPRPATRIEDPPHR